MGDKGNAASDEMPELSETIEHVNSYNIHVDNMAISYAAATTKNIYDKYDEEYWAKPIFILVTDVCGSHKPTPQ